MEKYKENYFKKFGCTNILHIGGHMGQEIKIYDGLGLDFTFVEPIPRYANILRSKGLNVIEAAVSNFRGVSKFNIARVSERSSLKKTTDDVATFKKVIQVKTVKLSDIQKGFDGVSIDAQGETFEILESGKLDFKVIICEASITPRYKGEASLFEIQAYLEARDYELVDQYRHKTLDIHDLVFKKI